MSKLSGIRDMDREIMDKVDDRELLTLVVSTNTLGVLFVMYKWTF
jgi:hypothetical protein